MSDGDTFRAKVRLVACGNFAWDVKRGDPKFKSSNVPPEAIRAIIISLIAQNPQWVCALLDIVTAFLNADSDDSEVILLRPPPVLKRLLKADEDEFWLEVKSCHFASRDWSCAGTAAVGSLGHHSRFMAYCSVF